MLELRLREVQQLIIREYTRSLNERCDYAQDQFDTITDHGREPISNEAAMKQALSNEEQHWASLAH